MTSPDTAVRQFVWKPDWLCLLLEAGLFVLFAAAALGLAAAGEWLWDMGDWRSVPAVIVWGLAVIFALLGGGGFAVVAILAGVHVSGVAVIVSVHRDRLWICESPQVDLFPKSVIVPFKSIVRVERERIGSNRECLRIVYGPELKSEIVAEIGPQDFAALAAVLRERCPNAFGSAFPPLTPVGR